MSNWFSGVWQFLRLDSGSTSFQHATVLALVVTVTIGGMQSFGTAVQDYFQESDCSFSLLGSDGAGSVTSERIRGRRIGQNVPQMSLKERLEVAEQRKARRIAELRERAARRQH